MNRAASVAASLALLVAGCKSAPRPFPEPTRVEVPPSRIVFEPPLQQEIVERSVTTRGEQVAGQPAQEESVTAMMTSRFDPEGEGYKLTQAIPEVTVTRNGEPVDNPLVALVTRFALEVRLAKDGSFVELLNPEAAEKAVRETFPAPEQAEEVLKYFTANALEAQAREEWKNKYGEFLGHDVFPGMAWYGLEGITTTSGQELSYVLQRKVVGIRQGDAGRELVIELSCPTRAEAAQKPEAMKALLEQSGVGSLEPSLSCTGEQVIALEPFAPVSNTLEVNATPTLDDGKKVSLILKRAVRTEQVGSTQR